MKLGNYKGLNIGYEKAEPVTKEMVDSELNNLLASKVSYNSVDKKAELGDTTNIDYEGFLDGVPFDGGKDNGYDLTLGSGSFIPGFEEGLVGFKKGDDVDVNVTFPDDYHAKDLAGKAVVFKCHINDVKVRIDAKLDDDLAKEFGLPTAEALMQALENQMNAKAEEEAQNKYLDKLIKTIVSSSEIEVSDEVSSKKVDEMLSYYEQQMAQYGMSLEAYLNMTGKTLDEFKETLKSDAMVEAKSDILLDEIAKQESISISDEELEARRAKWQPRQPRVTTGYLSRYEKMVTSGNRGAILEVK